jgi:rod shape-determining protein MreC
MELTGRSMSEGLTRKIIISSNEIQEALANKLNSIISPVKSELEKKQKKYFKDSVFTQVLNLNYQGQNHHFLVDKGETDGVYIGQIVVDKSGIVGQVIEVNNASSVVRTILSNELYLTGYIKSGKTIYQSLIHGDGRNLVVNYFNKTNNIKLGDGVFTTGDNLNIPKGLRIGKVKKLLNTDLNDFYKLVIEPSSNPYKERFLVIVK